VSLPGTWRWFEPDAEPVLSDDRAPIERLQERSLELAAEARAKGGL
jgi:hypothetical protein